VVGSHMVRYLMYKKKSMLCMHRIASNGISPVAVAT